MLKKKKRKTPEDIIILHLCTKNIDDVLYSSRNIERDRLKLVILSHFWAFTPFKNLKHQKFEKWKKLLEILWLRTCIPKITIIWCMAVFLTHLGNADIIADVKSKIIISRQHFFAKQFKTIKIKLKKWHMIDV